jgi:hypothetical protein
VRSAPVHLHHCLWPLLALGGKADAANRPSIQLLEPGTHAQHAVKEAHEAISSTWHSSTHVLSTSGNHGAQRHPMLFACTAQIMLRRPHCLCRAAPW